MKNPLLSILEWLNRLVLKANLNAQKALVDAQLAKIEGRSMWKALLGIKNKKKKQ